MKPFDTRGEFQPSTEGVHIRRLAIRGAGVTVLSSGVGLLFHILAAAVLARLLTPADFGVVTMVTTFSLLLLNFGLNGFTEAVLQVDRIDHALASNLFWTNVGAGLVLTLGFAASGSLMARFYGDSRVTVVAVGISLTILFNSMSVLHLALLKRAMRFSMISLIDILSRVCSVILSIILGWAGWGYWALVAGAIVLPISTCIGAWVACQWVPGRPRPVQGTGSMVAFALNTYGRFTVNYFARNMDNLLVGWRFNAQALGFYKKAYDLFALPTFLTVSPLTVVAVSTLSRLKENPVQYKKYLLNALGLIAFVGMGLGADLTLIGKDVIRLLLGPGWEVAGRIFVFFGPGIGAMLLYYTHGWIHLSIGRADRWFRWGILEFAVTTLLFVIGLPWGPAGIAVAWTASFVILTIPALWYAGQPIQFGMAPVIAVVWKYPLASLIAGFISDALRQRISSLAASSSTLTAMTNVVSISAVFGVIYLCIVFLLHRSFSPLYQLANLLGQMLPSTELLRSPALSVSRRTSVIVPSDQTS